MVEDPPKVGAILDGDGRRFRVRRDAGYLDVLLQIELVLQEKLERRLVDKIKLLRLELAIANRD